MHRQFASGGTYWPTDYGRQQKPAMQCKELLVAHAWPCMTAGGVKAMCIPRAVLWHAWRSRLSNIDSHMPGNWTDNMLSGGVTRETRKLGPQSCICTARNMMSYSYRHTQESGSMHSRHCGHSPEVLTCRDCPPRFHIVHKLARKTYSRGAWLRVGTL